MRSDHSIHFFDAHFAGQIDRQDYRLNPFEQAALPHLKGRVLDVGCGMGNLAVEAARRGCTVVALDGNQAAIEHLQRRAAAAGLPIDARVADLREPRITEPFDAIVSIGLLMFFDCATARRCLDNIRSQVRAGGIAVINVLIEGTTYLDMFDPAGHCLFGRDELQQQFAGWEILGVDYRDFDVPPGSEPAPGTSVRVQRKSFITLIARRPLPG